MVLGGDIGKLWDSWQRYVNNTYWNTNIEKELAFKTNRGLVMKTIVNFTLHSKEYTTNLETNVRHKQK
jgi:hypothetical protein